jgi:hypothetical protein
MPYDDPYTFFPAYAVFIGANMGIAAYVYFGQAIGMGLLYSLLRLFLMASLLFAALLALIGSTAIANHPDFGLASIRVLGFSYVIMVIIFFSGSKLSSDEMAVHDTINDHNLDS